MKKPCFYCGGDALGWMRSYAVPEGRQEHVCPDCYHKERKRPLYRFRGLYTIHGIKGLEKEVKELRAAAGGIRMTSTLSQSKPIGDREGSKRLLPRLPDAASVHSLSDEDRHRLDLEEYAIRMEGVA